MDGSKHYTEGPPEPRTPSVIWGLRFRTLLLVLLAVIPALLLMTHSAGRQRHIAAVRMRQTTVRLVRLVAFDVQGKVEGASELLSALAEIPAIRERDAAATTPILRRLLAKHPIYANIGAIAPNGDVFSSAVPLKGKVNLADRTYFQRAVKSRSFAVGDYQTGRITGMDTINFAYPVLDERGRLQAVVYVALRLDWMSQFSQWHLPDATTLIILDDRGTVLLSYPDPERWIGYRFPDSPLMRGLLSRFEGTAEGYILDSVERTIAFTPITTTGAGRNIYVVIGVPTDQVYREIDAVFRRSLLGMGVVAILALLAAWFGGDWFFLRQVKALVRAARRIRSGDLTARTGLRYGRDELSSLTYAFDAMADSLEHLTGRHELILSSAGEGIYGVDSRGHTAFVNPAAARMLGYAPEELIGHPHHEVFHHTRPDGTPYPLDQCPIAQTYQEGTSHRGDDEVFWRKDGTSFPVDYVATPAREHGQIIGAVVTFKDITQRKEAEQEVARAHEEVLQAALEKKQFYREVINAVSKNKLHLVDAGEIPTEGRLVAEGTLESPTDDRNARKLIRAAAEETGMHPDRARELTLAVGEATTNAVKHATQGRYAVYLTGDRVIVRVCDKGTGISTDNLPATILQPGFSTKVSMGMGYTLMLELADRVWLNTGTEGTTIQLEKWIEPAERPKSPLTVAVERV